jgi:hypothetical protein
MVYAEKLRETVAKIGIFFLQPTNKSNTFFAGYQIILTFA